MKTIAHLLAASLTLFGLTAPLSASAESWTFCATENTLCRVNGPSVVRFGVGDRFEHRDVNRPVMCSNRVFGDPAPGKKKDCSYRSIDTIDQGNWQGSGGSGHGNWETCALENGFCAFSGNREVRYGIDGQYRTRFAQGGVQCDNRSFGGDPYPGQPKECQVRGYADPGYPNRPPMTGRGANEGYTGAPSWDSDPQQHNRPGYGNGDQGWAFCAREDEHCNVPGTATVRFGAQGRYTVINHVRGRIACTKEVFGDPIYGVNKTCEYAPYTR